jgi:ankyrin repeat protein
LLKSASAAPPDAGSIISLSPPTVNTLTDGDDSSDEDDWDPDAYLGLDVSLELKVVFGAWRDALNGGDFDTCRALLDFCPDLLRSKGTKSVVEGGLRKESVEFLLGACLQRGASHQQLYSDLLQAALQAAACYAAQDAELYSMEFCIDKGADVNAGQQAFTEDSPLAIAMRQAWRWGNTDHVKVLLDHGAHVHADPTSPESKSALHFAIERFSTEFCELLLRHERVQVGGAELCAAAKVECASSLQLLLQAERNLGPSLRANAEERGRCLKEVLTVAVHSSVFNNRLPWKSRQIVEALLAAPAHWHPLPPDLLDVGMKEVLTVTNKHGLRWELCEVVEVLGKAGADLNIEEGALLMAATKAGWYTRKEFLKALLRGGLDIRIHGGAALMAAPDDHFAAELIRAGAPVNSDPALCKRLMELAAGWSLKDIGPLLGALEKDGAGVKGELQRWILHARDCQSIEHSRPGKCSMWPLQPLLLDKSPVL